MPDPRITKVMWRHKLTGKLITHDQWYALPYERKNDYYAITI